MACVFQLRQMILSRDTHECDRGSMENLMMLIHHWVWEELLRDLNELNADVMNVMLLPFVSWCAGAWTESRQQYQTEGGVRQACKRPWLTWRDVVILKDMG